MAVQAILAFYDESIRTLLDLAPIVVLIGMFQFGVIRRPIPHFPRMLVGLFYVALGLTLFRIGISESLIPVGRDMARQLVEVAAAHGEATMGNYLPVLTFSVVIGFTATLIEPTLIFASERVQALSGGTLKSITLRLLVAVGVAIGLLLGTLRIIAGVPLAWLVAAMAACLIAMTLVAPRSIVPVALDSGAIATSVVTVPLIAAYGMAVAQALPHEGAAADGFGLVALALMSPIILLLGFAWLQTLLTGRTNSGGSDAV